MRNFFSAEILIEIRTETPADIRHEICTELDFEIFCKIHTEVRGENGTKKSHWNS